jgi:hypothetical protein
LIDNITKNETSSQVIIDFILLSSKHATYTPNDQSTMLDRQSQ